MPCVFPVLSIKILSLVKQVGEDKQLVLAHGWVYLIGDTISFVAMALTLVALRAAGAQIGWGFQLQSPMLVALLAYLFFLIGLSLSGYFEIGVSLINLGSGLAEKGVMQVLLQLESLRLWWRHLAQHHSWRVRLDSH